jgi:hypothetical protein
MIGKGRSGRDKVSVGMSSCSSAICGRGELPLVRWIYEGNASLSASPDERELIPTGPTA